MNSCMIIIIFSVADSFTIIIIKSMSQKKFIWYAQADDKTKNHQVKMNLAVSMKRENHHIIF